MFRIRLTSTSPFARQSNPACAPPAAPRRLRGRVLAGVRGERDDAHAAGRRSRRRPLPALALALAVGIGLGGISMQALFSDGAPAANTVPVRGASATLRRTGERAELIVRGMPEPPPGEAYEVWLIGPGASPQPTDALFTVTRSGSGTVEVPGGLGHGVREVMVSSEPLGGRPAPTSTAIVRVRAPA